MTLRTPASSVIAMTDRSAALHREPAPPPRRVAPQRGAPAPTPARTARTGHAPARGTARSAATAPPAWSCPEHAVGAEPGHGVLDRHAQRARCITEFAHRLGRRVEHLVPRHLDMVTRHHRRDPG